MAAGSPPSGGARLGPRRPLPLPGWLHWTVAAGLAALVAVALVGVPLAMLGWLRPAPFAALATAAFALLLAGWPRPAGAAPRAARLPGALAGAVAAVITGLDAAHAGQHLLTDRDPGVYVTTGRWLAATGHLLLDGARGPFAAAHLSAAGQGFASGAPGHSLYPQFLHVLPVALAVGDWAHGTGGLLMVNPFVGGIALLAVYAAACRFVRPWVALVAMTALGSDVAFWHFARDAFTEIAEAALVFGAVWVLTRAAGRAAWARGGLLVGVACMTHVDAYLVAVPFVIWLAARWAADRDRPGAVAALAGLAVPAGLGLADGALFSPHYLRSVGGALAEVAALVAVALIAGRVAGVALDRRSRRRRGRMAPASGWWRAAGMVAAAAVIAGTAWAWFGRPSASHPVERRAAVPDAYVANLQRQQAMPVQPGRTYAEQTAHWIGLYTGGAAIVLAAAGTAVAAAEGTRRRADDLLLLAGLLAIPAAAYLWRPSITPDQIFAMRRFLPVVLPGVAITGGLVADRALRWRSPRVAAAGGAAFLAALVAFPVWASAAVFSDTPEQGSAAAVAAVCRAAGPRAAILIVPGGGLEVVAPQTLEAFCGVPVAVATTAQAASNLAFLASGWAARGRVLTVVGDDRAGLSAAGATGPHLVVRTDLVGLRPVLNRRPHTFVTRPLTVWEAVVPTSNQ